MSKAARQAHNERVARARQDKINKGYISQVSQKVSHAKYIGNDAPVMSMSQANKTRSKPYQQRKERSFYIKAKGYYSETL